MKESEKKEYIKEHANEILNDYTWAKIAFDGLPIARVRKLLELQLIIGASEIRDENGMIDINFNSLTFTIIDKDGIAELGSFAEVWDRDGNLVTSSFDCDLELKKVIEEKLRENILFVQSLFHKDGGSAEQKEVDKITEESLMLLDKITL